MGGGVWYKTDDDNCKTLLLWSISLDYCIQETYTKQTPGDTFVPKHTFIIYCPVPDVL